MDMGSPRLPEDPIKDFTRSDLLEVARELRENGLASDRPVAEAAERLAELLPDDEATVGSLSADELFDMTLQLHLANIEAGEDPA